MGVSAKIAICAGSGGSSPEGLAVLGHELDAHLKPLAGSLRPTLEKVNTLLAMDQDFLRPVQAVLQQLLEPR